MRVGRNESCPCGSGRKFKSCCAGKAAPPKGLIVLLAVFAIIVGIAFIPRDDNKTVAPLPPAPRTAAAKPGPQPPGPVPPGKVWSVEHGHWHDIRTGAGTNPASSIKVEQSPGLKSKVPMTTVVTPVQNTPQPAGPVPPGKVWSPEHGHWHDAK